MNTRIDSGRAVRKAVAAGVVVVAVSSAACDWIPELARDLSLRAACREVWQGAEPPYRTHGTDRNGTLDRCVTLIDPRPVDPDRTLTTATPQTLGDLSQILRQWDADFARGLADADANGTVTVSFLVDPAGSVRDSHIAESSGHVPLDEAALELAHSFEFAPLDGGQGLGPVSMEFAVSFHSR